MSRRVLVIAVAVAAAAGAVLPGLYKRLQEDVKARPNTDAAEKSW